MPAFEEITVSRPPEAAEAARVRPGIRRVPERTQGRRRRNVGGVERFVSVAAGSMLAVLGLSRRGWLGFAMAGAGGALVYRGATGHSFLYDALGADTAGVEPARPEDYSSRGIHVEHSCIIDRPAAELYRYWRDFTNLPLIMRHLESVTVRPDGRSRWVAKAPAIAGGTVAWDAEILHDQPDRLIAWRSLAGADVDNSGSVRFVEARGGRGTQVHVVIEYIPPAGRLGQWVARLFGEEPHQQIRDDLRNFKRVLETGEIPTIQGQPRGDCAGSGGRHSGW